MSLPIYQASIPVFIRQLQNFAAVLRKAEDDAAARKIDAAVFPNSRLAPDMFPLIRQVQIATDGVKGCGARLAGVPVPSFADTETTFAELQARIAKTVEFLTSLDAASFEGAETRIIQLKVGGHELAFTGSDYLLNFVIPNFYFHFGMAYAILRHNGVAIGKMDFLGELPQMKAANAA